jgi:hypothetical protein
MIRQLVQERNEAWNERDLLRQRVEELDEYNVNLHEEFHVLYNGIGPYAPPDATGMDVDDDEDEPIVAPADDDDVATNGSKGDVSDPDDGPEEQASCFTLATSPCHSDLSFGFMYLDVSHFEP